jgi:zinc/manganese transport system permease protein
MTTLPWDPLSLLAPTFAACALFVAIHMVFGLHVLKRGVIFIDLALAQISALGATIAFAVGHVPTSTAGLAYTLLFSAIGAAFLTVGRLLPKAIHAEAYIGILYVVATAATIIVVDRSPQGSEHVKQMLVGSILTVTANDLLKFATVYGAIGFFHWLARRPLQAATEGRAGAHSTNALLWDFLFYLSFGVVVTSSVATAGILLVFCFLIIPSIIGSLFSHRVASILWIGWVGGTTASALGLTASFEFNLPAGAAMVLAFALTLVAAVVLSAFVSVTARERRYRLRSLVRGAVASFLMVVCGAVIWLMVMPRADQPLLELFEWATGTGPEAFLTPAERAVYANALKSARFRQSQVTQLTTLEQQSRWQGDGLSDEAIRRATTFQQAYNEMARGEEFVLQSLSGHARARERWEVGPPLLAVALVGLLAILPGKWRACLLRRRQRSNPTPTSRPIQERYSLLSLVMPTRVGGRPARGARFLRRIREMSTSIIPGGGL